MLNSERGTILYFPVAMLKNQNVEISAISYLWAVWNLSDPAPYNCRKSKWEK